MSLINTLRLEGTGKHLASCDWTSQMVFASMDGKARSRKAVQVAESDVPHGVVSRIERLGGNLERKETSEKAFLPL